MQLTKQLPTTAIRFLVPDAGNNAFIPDVIRGIQERYRFWRVPASLSEYKKESGAEFEIGLFGSTPIDSLKVYSNGIRTEASAPTEELDAFLDDMLGYVGDAFGLRYQAMAPVEKAYISALEVRADAQLSFRLKAMEELWETLTSMVTAYGSTISPYQLASVSANSDPQSATPLEPNRFLFERRVGHPFSSNVYFSEAPVSTQQHLMLLNMFETIWTTA